MLVSHVSDFDLYPCGCDVKQDGQAISGAVQREWSESLDKYAKISDAAQFQWHAKRGFALNLSRPVLCEFFTDSLPDHCKIGVSSDGAFKK